MLIIKDGIQKETLRTTIRRDLSLFSVQAWQQGYGKYLQSKLGWYYNVIFFYNGNVVTFYHRQSDFSYLEEVITKKLINDTRLFHELGTRFKKDVRDLTSLLDNLSQQNITLAFELTGQIMSLYMFIISDSFAESQSDAWRLRNLSKDVLYTLDDKVKDFIKHLLRDNNYPDDISRYLTIQEIHDLMDGKSINRSSIQVRTKGYIVFNEALITDTPFDTFCDTYDFINPEEKENLHSKNILGNTTYPGKIVGTVKIVNTKKDIEKVRAGDVLVSRMTNINILPAMKLAVAVITDEGGATCHTAITARKLKKPCIINTKTATTKLKDGDIVEVDADNGIIKIL